MCKKEKKKGFKKGQQRIHVLRMVKSAVFCSVFIDFVQLLVEEPVI